MFFGRKRLSDLPFIDGKRNVIINMQPVLSVTSCGKCTLGYY